ncbi:MAG: hypothetical protein ACYC9W_00035 [Candidatus Limnocylindria bacterium]
MLAGYAVPPAFLAISLAAYVLIATCAAALLAAAVTYAGWHRARSRPDGVNRPDTPR